ncbi:GNAT family N-acetyltransferase [Patescibacteria group bacterium]|nr:GNAT family N-acetyltransferase [Patescibacteria group bacterium]
MANRSELGISAGSEALRQGPRGRGIQEKISRSIIEVRFAVLERDAKKIAEIFCQPLTIEHLSGMAPTERTSEVNVKKYAEKYPRLNIAIATEQGIKDLYRPYEIGQSNIALLVAEDKNTGQVVGTVTVERPTGPGLTYASISRLAVEENAREKKIGGELLRSACALIFLPKEDRGYGQFGAQVGIIQDVLGYQIPQKMFQDFGYRVIGNPVGNCVGWDSRSRRFVPRDTLFLQLQRDSFFQLHTARSLIKSLPR